MRRAALLAGTVAAFAAGCGGTKAAAPSSTTASVTSPSGTQVTATVTPTAPSSTAATLPAYCLTSELTVTLEDVQGAGGTEISDLHVLNKSSRTCTVTGYLGVSYVAPGSGQQVGSPATRQGTGATTISLAPGAEASARYETPNVKPTGCTLVPVSGVRVYPPDDKDSVYVAYSAQGKVCPAQGSDIYPLRAGTHGSAS